MIKAKFYCDIFGEDGELTPKNKGSTRFESKNGAKVTYDFLVCNLKERNYGI